MSSKRGLQIAQNAAEFCIKYGCYDKILKPLEIISAGDGQCVAEFTVTQEQLNPHGGIHGGFTATVIDNFSTYGLMTTEAHPGISVNMYLNFMKAAREGDRIIVDATTTKAGSRFAFLECELKRKSDGALIARGGQTKFIDLPIGKFAKIYEVAEK